MGIPETPTTDAVGMERRVRRLEKALASSKNLIIDGGVSWPSNPQNGQEVDYVANTTLGIMWRFRYLSAIPGNYKWAFVGGAPLWAYNDQPWYSLTSVADGTWQTPAGDWNQTLPLAGDYMIRYHANFQWRTFATGGYQWMEAQAALRYNGVRDDISPHSWNYGIIEQDMADTAAGYVGVGMELSKEFRKNGVTANAVVTPTYRINNNAAQVAYMLESAASFLPIRVGP